MTTYSDQMTSHSFVQRPISLGQSNAEHSSNQFSQSIDLSIRNCSPVEWDLLCTDKFNRILSAIKFNSLNIYSDAMFICTLIKLIHLLPDLHSLKVASVPNSNVNNLSAEDAESLRLLSINNKITKVSQWMDFELIDFLINLCPRMQHLEVMWVECKDLQTLVRIILMKTITHIPRLHSLRINVRDGGDEIVNELQKMIDSEKLLADYIIQRSDNDINLQWK
jgi:hypothetical protein